MRRFYIILFTLVVSFQHLNAQNLEEISLKKKVKLSGSVNFNTVGYHAFGIEQRRDPFTWIASANLNINVFGYNAPFSFTYSNANQSFSQPFNQFNFSPQYKWIKTYLGNTSMTFSPYTLAGHMFFGAGVEITKDQWQVAAMYGKLRSAVPPDFSDSTSFSNVSYKRMGYGMKAAYSANGNQIMVNFFAAKDDVSSIPNISAISETTPQQNIAVSLGGKKKISKGLFIEGEYALSALNTNTLANLADTAETEASNFAGELLPSNLTTRYFDAIRTSIGYTKRNYGIQFKYERVSPDYQTLGAYFFNNDLENITIAPNVKLLENKLSLSANIGLQKNNLDNTKSSTSSRNVGSVNIGYVPDDKWNLNTSYSNFTSFTNMDPIRDPFSQDLIDTLDFFQINQTFTLGVSRAIGSKDNPQSLSLNGSFQGTNDEREYEGGSSSSSAKSANISYSYNLVAAEMTFLTSLNTYINEAAGIQSKFFGPTLSVNRSLLEKKMQLSYSGSYSKTMSDNLVASPILSHQINISYQPASAKEEGGGKHNITSSISVVSRLRKIEEQNNYTEMTINFSYNYTF